MSTLINVETPMCTAEHALEEFNQIRTRTYVFIRFPTLDVAEFSNPSIINLAQTLLNIVIKISQKNGGCCRQFGCDDKTTTILLVWGMEGFAQERGESYHAMKSQ